MFISKKKFEEAKGQCYVTGRNEEKCSRDRAIKNQASEIATCLILLKNIEERVTDIANTKRIADRINMSEATCGDIEQIVHGIRNALKEIML